MTSGLIFGVAVITLAAVIVAGLMRRSREAPAGDRSSIDGPTAVAQWTEGETTRLLSSAEVPGLYLLREKPLPVLGTSALTPGVETLMDTRPISGRPRRV